MTPGGAWRRLVTPGVSCPTFEPGPSNARADPTKDPTKDATKQFAPASVFALTRESRLVTATAGSIWNHRQTGINDMILSCWAVLRTE